MLGDVRVSVYRTQAETAMVLKYGRINEGHPLTVRVQSSCAYGEVFLSSACDCREQLIETYRIFKERGSGVFIYLDQEGRGAGLADKARAYELEQECGLDTVEAYRRLGIPVDRRTYGLAGQILVNLEISRVTLLTNNLRKLEDLRDCNLTVVREPLHPPITNNNSSYLATKQEKLGHLLNVAPKVPTLF